MTSRVLIIEDEMVTQHLLARLVESEGHSVSVAQSCAEAEALVMRETYGLILLDLVLGKEDGLAILRRIRARQRAPIVIISGKSDSTDIITGLELGADDYVLKPFDVAVLRARLRTHLRRAEWPAEPAEESIALGNAERWRCPWSSICPRVTRAGCRSTRWKRRGAVASRSSVPWSARSA